MDALICPECQSYDIREMFTYHHINGYEIVYECLNCANILTRWEETIE